MKKLITTITALTTAFLLTSCEDTTSNLGEHHDDHDNMTFAEIVADVDHHMEDGPFVAIVPTTTEDNAPTINAEHTCYTFTPTATEAFVSYTVTLEGSETAADRSLFFSVEGITAHLVEHHEEHTRAEEHGHEHEGHAADLDEISTNVVKAGLIFHGLEAGEYAVELTGLPVGTPVKMVMAHGGDEGGEGHEGHDH